MRCSGNGNRDCGHLTRDGRNRFARYRAALALLAVYVVMTLSVLAPLTLHSSAIALAVTGECTGDCTLCGCSTERSATHTCCCWQKRVHREHGHDESQAGDCCKGKRHDRGPTLKGNGSCGNSKQLAFLGPTASEQIPFHYTQIGPVYYTGTICTSPVNRLTSCHGEPPDPPPKLAFIA